MSGVDLGAIVGKFLPPHRGHHHLIDTALAGCERVVVFVCERPDDPIPGARRAEWIVQRHPRVEVQVIDDRYDAQDSKVWADNVRRWLGRAPDAVFTSEDYGDDFARHLGAHHFKVDPLRRTVPISGTTIRRDPHAHWDFLESGARGWYARRVVVLGAESTGTTTLARTLAESLDTQWVPEYGREYSWTRDMSKPWTDWEFEQIAAEQNFREDAAAGQCNRVLVCDTDSLATLIWQRRYMGRPSAGVARLATARRADLYLLTGDEIPFVQDGIRDGEHIRHDMHRWFEKLLAAQRVPWAVLRGDQAERLEAAQRAVGALFEFSAWKPRNVAPLP